MLNLTNSDDIPFIEELIMRHPDYEFHIGAITEMSEKLLSLERYANVALYPTITTSMLDRLFKVCDIYLDINRGGEISNALERAMLHEQLIFAYEETVHRSKFIALENIVPLQQFNELSQILKHMSQDKEEFKARLKLQKIQNSQIDRQQFKKVLKQTIK